MTKGLPVVSRSTLAVALVYPPVEMADEAGWMAGLYNQIPPLGIAYLAARLRQDGHRVACFDSSGGRFTHAQLRDALGRFSPDLVGISSSTFAQT